MSARLRSGCLAIAIAVVGGAAASPAQAASAADRLLAKQYYRLGQTLFNQASYAEAFVQFQKAYEASGRPALLYNMARCQELLGQIGQAVALYRRYLSEAGNPRDRADIEARIRNLERRTGGGAAPAAGAAASGLASAGRGIERGFMR